MDIPNGIIIRKFIPLAKYENGGSIWLMKGLDPKASDYHDLVEISRIWARQGRQVFILAPIHFKDTLYPLIFGPLTGTIYDRKCPDLLVDGKFYEYESFQSPWTRSKISHMFKQGLKQSSRIIVNNNKGGSHRFYRNRIYARLSKGCRINEVWIFERNELILIYKKQGSL